MSSQASRRGESDANGGVEKGICRFAESDDYLESAMRIDASEYVVTVMPQECLEGGSARDCKSCRSERLRTKKVAGSPAKICPCRNGFFPVNWHSQVFGCAVTVD